MNTQNNQYLDDYVEKYRDTKKSGLKTLISLMGLLLSSVKNTISMVFLGRNLGLYCSSVIRSKLNLAERLRSLTIPSSWRVCSTQVAEMGAKAPMPG